MSVKETSSSTRLRRIVDEPLAAINEVLKERKVPWIQRQLAIIAVGTLKETIDRGRGGRWDAEDFGATVLGGMMPRIQLVYRF